MSASGYRLGEGKISGSLSLFLGALCIGGVLCFHFPEYLTTPELRRSYDIETMRHVLRGAMFLSVFLGSLTFFLSKRKRMGFAGIVLTLIAQALGGSTVEVGDFESSQVSFGLDWLVLDLLSSTLIFIFLEKLFPHKKDQAILRPEWNEDLVFFAFNHLLISYVLLVVTKFSATLVGWAISANVQIFVQSFPKIVQFAVAIFVADFMQYWGHRAMHEVPALWKFHSIHHSPAAMDWLSGSRLHLFEILATRTLVFASIFLLGFSADVINAYVIFVGVQAVLNHANVNISFGPIRQHLYPFRSEKDDERAATSTPS